MSMTQSQILIYPEVGPVLYERSRKARRVSISIRPSRGIRVAVPFSVSFSLAEQAVLSKFSWIERHLAIIRHEERHRAELTTDFVSPDRVTAKRVLTERLNELALLHGFHYNKLTFREQKTRWGSCSSNNNISLNLKLACIPVELMDFVLLHELVHTRIKNHGPAFKADLEKLVSNFRDLRSRLRLYQAILYN